MTPAPALQHDLPRACAGDAVKDVIMAAAHIRGKASLAERL
jgi:hypothetical protein